MKLKSDIMFSVLDLASVREGWTVAGNFRNSLTLAQLAEKWPPFCFLRKFSNFRVSLEGMGALAQIRYHAPRDQLHWEIPSSCC